MTFIFFQGVYSENALHVVAPVNGIDVGAAQPIPFRTVSMPRLLEITLPPTSRADSPRSAGKV